MKKLLFTLCCLMAFIGIARASTQTENTLGHRSYVFFEPTTPLNPCPLAVSYHPGVSFNSSGTTTGWNGGATSLNNTLNEEAERLGFCVAYPNGTYRTQFFQTWNVKDKRCCGFASETKADDAEFIRRMIADLAQNENIDTSNIVHTGYSNGSMMALAFGCRYPDLFDGFVGASGPLMLDEDECAAFPDAQATYIYGTADTTVPPAGGIGDTETASFPAAQDTIDFLSGKVSDFDYIALTGAGHSFSDIVSYLSSQESLVYASAIGRTILPALDSVISSTVLDIDATRADSYASGQTLTNLAATATDYDFWNGTSSGTTADCTFTGDAGDNDAYFLCAAAASGFQIKSASVAAQPAVILNAHKVTNTTGVTFATRLVMPSSVTGSGGNIFGDENTSSKNGFRLYYNHTSSRFELRIWRTPSAAVSFNFTNLSMAVSKEYMLFLTMLGNGTTQTTAKLYVYNLTDGTMASQELTANNNDTTDATGFMVWGNDDSVGDALRNARYKWFGIFNDDITEAQTELAKDHVLAR